ncbi:MAG: ATP-dependent RecD-like DNA helicase [Bacteroidia bacterium]
METQNIAKLLRLQLKFSPTLGQEAFIEAFSEFLGSRLARKIFILKGYAGTGKTTMIGAVVKSLSPFKMRSVLLAPTGRAAKVMSKYTQKQAFTIHKKIYVKKSIDGVTQFVLNKNLHSNTLFIVDEASMISSGVTISLGVLGKRALIDDLIEYVYSGKNCHLIFVGDEAQLPPVGENTSIALDERELLKSYHFDFSKSIKLKEVVRQAKESGVLKVATDIRENIKNTSFPKIKLNNDLLYLSGNELQEKLEEIYQKFGKDNTIIITRSNKRANLYNQNVRQRILGFEEEIDNGDLLMVVKNNYFWLDDESKMGFIANGDVVRVKRVLKEWQLYGFRFKDLIVEFPDYPDEPEHEVKIILDSIYTESPSLTREQQKQLYYAVADDYSEIKNKRKLMEKVLQDPFFNALQVKFSYAVTCHKAQGGQWSVVFLDQGYITEEMLGYEFNRWLYTAITRASQRVYLVNFSKEFFNVK